MAIESDAASKPGRSIASRSRARDTCRFISRALPLEPCR